MMDLRGYLVFWHVVCILQIHCVNARPFELISCLTKYKDDVDFDYKCRKVIQTREVVKSKGTKLITLSFQLNFTFPRWNSELLQNSSITKPFWYPDYRLNPTLQKSCRMDIPKFCKAELAEQTKDQEMEGKIINCLKIQFRKHVSILHSR